MNNAWLDMLFLVEMWHNSDYITSVYVTCATVIDRHRPRSRTNTIITNRDGIAAVAVAGIRLTSCDFGFRLSMIDK